MAGQSEVLWSEAGDAHEDLIKQHKLDDSTEQPNFVRVEIVPELNHPGIILESENSLIDGSLEGVFQNIDKIFEQVVKHE
jgi:hypothetical protein